MIRIHSFAVGEIGVNCYLIKNDETHQVVIVDPGADAQRIIDIVGDEQCAGVLLTHGHYDHIGAVDEICAHFGVDVYIHEADADKLSDPKKNLSAQFAEPISISTKPILVKDGDEINLANIPFTVLSTPGHSEGSVCYRLPEKHGILCGDTLFLGGYGRTDFYDGDFHKLKASLKLLMFSTPKIPAYPGHGASTFAGRDTVKA